MNTKHYTILALFALAAALTFFCGVEKRHVQAKPINLAAVPEVFGDWRMVNQNTSVGSKESKFLDDVLVRTYQRKDGKTVMLAIAYGADQRKKFSIHLPEICYKAAGCEVVPIGQVIMNSPNIKLKQLVVKSSTVGTEAVQYWIVVDGKVVTSEFDRKLKHVYYGFFGADAGGVLMRVSSLTSDKDYRKDYEVQKEFSSALYATMNKDQKRLLFGDEKQCD